MSTKEQREHLERRLGELIERFKRDRQRHKRLAVPLKALTVSLAGIVTVLLGWKEAPSAAIPPLFGHVALLLRATITVVRPYEALFAPPLLWVRETVAS